MTESTDIIVIKTKKKLNIFRISSILQESEKHLIGVFLKLYKFLDLVVKTAVKVSTCDSEPFEALHIDVTGKC